MVKPKIFFYVQHLLGIGHIKRATTLARAMSTTGFDVTLVSGGRHVPVINEKGMKFIQLPALRSLDRTFKGLIDDEGKEISDQIREKRRNKLMDILDNILPDILIVEMFPFGRKMLEFEIIPLLDKARWSISVIQKEKRKWLRKREGILTVFWFMVTKNLFRLMQLFL